VSSVSSGCQLGRLIFSAASFGICVYSGSTARTASGFSAEYRSDFSIAVLKRSISSGLDSIICFDAK
jgi:hypothetical protein